MVVRIKNNPFKSEMPIDPNATAVHGITIEDLKDAPTFKAIAQTLANTFEGCDFAGYNSNKFDLPLLAEEFFALTLILILKNENLLMFR